MDHPTTLIYLADAETLSQLHPDWPSDLRVALCLEEGGASDVIFIRQDEIEEAPERVATLLERDDADFVIVPMLGGYPTRRLSFSQEQQLCGLLADMVELPDQARSNFDYLAESNGLSDEIGCESEILKKPVVASSIAQAHPAVHPALAEIADEVIGHWGRVERSGTVWCFTVDGMPECDDHPPSIFAHPIALSDDRRRLQAVLALATDWRGGLPQAFQMPVDGLPDGCPDLQDGTTHRVFFRSEGTALTITLPVLKPAASSSPVADTAKPRRRRFLGPALAAATALVMVQVGTSPDAIDAMRAAGTFQSGFQDR